MPVNEKTSPHPKIHLWNHQSPKILWINEGFRHSRHLALRGLDCNALKDSFGTADHEEALRRQNLIRLLVGSDALRVFALQNHFDYCGKIVHIPSGGQDFVNYFDPQRRNAFWEKTEEFTDIIATIKDTDTSLLENNPAVATLAECLNEERGRLEQREVAMGSHVIDELLKSTEIDGTVTVQLQMLNGNWTFVVVGKEAVGHRLYALNPPNEYVSISLFWDQRLWHATGIYKFMCWRAQKSKQYEIRQWANPIIMTDCPKEVAADICAYMNDQLRENLEKGFPLPADPKDLVDLVVRFSYREDGLRIKVVGLSSAQQIPSSYESSWVTKMSVGRFRYYSEAQLNKAQLLSEETRQRSYVTQLLTNFYPKLHQWFTSNIAGLVTDIGIVITSGNSDVLFRWCQATMLCNTDEWKETYEAARAIRAYTAEHMKVLRFVAEIAQAFVSKAKEWNLPITFPELVEGNTANLSFKELWPVDLIGRETSGSKGRSIEASDLRPITALGDLTGGISMITGGNGAGKTTTGEELLGVLLDAGSGFPVFGKGVRLNLRTVVGSIFLERGDGSTMQLSLVKLAAVLKEVEKHPKNGTFVFWDEAGTGTTASQGEILGMAALTKLQRIGCTILVNTQIPSLAERAQSQLGARCFQVGMDHRIRSGIGEPDIKELAELMGVDKVLDLN